MTKQEILDHFKDIDVMYNDSSKHETLSRMLDELLKEQMPVKPYQDYNGHDIWRCGKCGATICNIYHTEVDEDSKNYAKFCIKALKTSG